MTDQSEVGIIGAGSFGTAIARLAWINRPVLIYTRNPETYDKISKERRYNGLDIPAHVSCTLSPEELTTRCRIIFPVVGSSNFRDMMQDFKPYLSPRHLLIHGTKGFDVVPNTSKLVAEDELTRDHVLTMSDVILQESDVLRVGCLSGPNLAKEILQGNPTATVIASRYAEIIKEGQEALSSDQFFVFGSDDIKAAEIAGALKNIFAIGSGMLGGLNMGKNAQSMLITRGLHEMIHFGTAMGTSSEAFMGTAGVGDLVATATSDLSRNYTFGYRLAQGESMEEILSSSDEVYEGVRTLDIVYRLSRSYKIFTPVTSLLYKVVYKNHDIQKGINYLMRYPHGDDVEF